MIDTMIGQKFNMLTVLRRIDDGNYKKMYFCKCDCGKTSVVRKEYLLSGHTKSCGCQKGLKKVRPEKTKDVDDGTRKLAMRMWKDITKINPNNMNNGICELWRNFDNFYEWFLQFGINEPCRIERRDTKRKYSPKNCYLIRKKGIDARELPKLK